MMSKQKIIIFGTGLGGERAFHTFSKKYNIIAFVDNDSSKHGTRLLERPIKAPSELTQLEYEKIYIASMYHAEITQQLQNEFGIPAAKIIRVNNKILQGNKDEEIVWGCLVIILMLFTFIIWVVYQLLV